MAKNSIFKKIFRKHKLEKYELETIISLIGKHREECCFNTDYTIFKLKNYLSKK